jgi:hypothetical protein
MKPNLKIVSVKEISPVMDYRERRVEHLRQAIGKTGSIRNLFNLASVGAHEFLLLEDAAILEAVRRLNLEYVPAQVVPLKRQKKIRANISLNGMNCSHIDEFSQMFPRTFTVEQHGCESDVSDRIVVSINRNDQSDIIMSFKRNSVGLISGTVFDFFRFLKMHCSLNEKVYPNSIKNTNVKKNSENCSLSVSGLLPNDLLFAVRQNYFFPAGLLRFDNGIRIIGIDYPLSILYENVTIREKERFLLDLMNYRLSSGYSHFIKNGVYLLNY